MSARYANFAAGRAGGVALLLVLPLALVTCRSKHDRCVDAVGHIRPALPASKVDSAVDRCVSDPGALTFLECAPTNWNWTSYDQVLTCLEQSQMILARPPPGSALDTQSLPSGVAAKAAAAACAGPPSLPAPPMISAATYRPDVHGFRFSNSCYVGHDTWACCEISAGAQGCCEGMSYGSLDYYKRGMELPRIAWPAVGLPEWNALDGWVKGRQLETGWANWAEFLMLTTTDDVDKATITAGAWPRIKSAIDGGEPTLIGLGPNSPWVWDAHAVVAWAYAENGPQKWLGIYDPNLPGNAGVVLEWSETDSPIRIREYASDTDACAYEQWTALDHLDYSEPGVRAGSTVPSLFTTSQILGTDGAFVRQIDPATGPNGTALMLRAGVSFSTETDIELLALGGTSDRVIGILGSDITPFQCLPSGGPCNPPAETSFHEIYSGIEGTVRPDGTFCYTNAGGLVTPDHAFIPRFTLRSDCSGPPVMPPPNCAMTSPPTCPQNGHTVRVRFDSVDDDAYVWAGLPTHIVPSDTTDAVCSAAISRGGDNSCDITDRLRDFGQYSELIFKVGNSGGFGSQANMYIEIDGNVAWEGHERDSGWKHTGWTYRAYVSVDRINGTATEIGVDSCYNLLDCEN
jgi:hypothetical protein